MQKVVSLKSLEILHTRNSVARLTGEVNADQIEAMLQAGFRAPDHAQLKPWRVLIIEGEARETLGALFAQAKLTEDPDQTPEKLAKLKDKPLRAPLIFVVAAKITEHAQVPEIEQILSAGSVAHNILNAAHGLGLGAMWRTGSMTYNGVVHTGLGLKENEKIVGFVYVGEVDGKVKKISKIDTANYASRWE